MKPILAFVLDVLLVILIALLAFIILGGGDRVQIGETTITFRNTRNPTIALILLLLARRWAGGSAGLQASPIIRSLSALGSRLVGSLSTTARIVFVAALAVFLHAALMSWITIRRHESFSSHAYDLGIVDQIVWNAANGRGFTSSILGHHFFGEHFSPILYALVPLYLIAEDVRLALAFQSFALALGAVPIFLLARRALGPLPALGFVGLYLAYSPGRNVNLFDIHEIAFVTPILLFACWFLETRRYKALAIACFLALLCKEEIGLVVAGIGAFLFLVRKERVWGTALFCFGLAWIGAAVLAIIPHFRGTEYAFVDRYASLGRTPAQMLTTLLTHPWLPITELFEGKKLTYVLQVFGPLAFLSFAAPSTLLLAAPPFFLSTLSDYPPQSSTAFQYTAPLTPFVFYSAIQGRARLWGTEPETRVGMFRWSLSRGAFAGVVLLCAVLFLGNSPAYHWKRFAPQERHHAMETVLRGIDPEISVSAQASLVPHLSQRQEITQFPNVGDAAVICLDLDAVPLPITKEEREEIVSGLLQRGEYALIRKEGSLRILERQRWPWRATSSE